MDATKEMFCPMCGVALPLDAYFCSRCGVKIRESLVSTSAGKQAVIYLVSFFLAPFGLVYVFKYMRQSDPKARKIGIAALTITIFAIVFMLWTAKAFLDWYSNLLNSLTL